MTRNYRTHTRRGFTLVELMIAAAITVLIMTVLSICFQTSMKAMSAMRAQGDAADQLRAVGEVIKRDFKADHHLPMEPDPSGLILNSGKRISDYRFDNLATPAPATGFVYIQSPASTMEGNDGSFDSTLGGNSTVVWFTCVLPGGSDANVYTATSGGVVFTSEAAEVAYFLLPNGQFTSGSPQLPLYNLYRRQRLVAMSTDKQATFPAADFEVISTFLAPGPTVNTMNTLASGTRNGVALSPLFSAGRIGDDIILSNVLSFEVKPTWTTQVPASFPPPRPFPPFGPTGLSVGAVDNNNLTNPYSTDSPYDTLHMYTAPNPYTNMTSTFDTLSLGTSRIRVNGVQVRLRVYDTKVKTARQLSLVFDQ